MGNNSKSSAATVQEVQPKNAPEAAKQIETRNKPKHLPPYKVLLHNDEVNTFEHVITSIVKITTLSTQEAIIRTLEAHESGLALLLTTHRERAELFIEQFASLSLKTTTEPAE